MSAAIPLRGDYDGPALRALAKASKDANQTRRLLSLAVIYEGGRRSEAAALGGVGLQIVRDWVLRFNAEGPEGLIDRQPAGASPKLSDAQRRALCEIVESGPIPAIHGVVRWRLKDLVQWITPLKISYIEKSFHGQKTCRCSYYSRASMLVLAGSTSVRSMSYQPVDEAGSRREEFGLIL